MFLGGLPDGGYKESDIAFRKAIELAPDVIRNHYELGKVYRCQDRNREALTEFRKVLLLPIVIGKDRQMKYSAGKLAREMENWSREVISQSKSTKALAYAGAFF